MIFLNEKSYTDLMKVAAMKRNQRKENFVQDLYIDMLLSEIQLTVEKEKLLRKIDSAIDRRDKKLFLQLSRQLREINKKFGT
ncbi:IDEAL domain-containing protein [Neobacillus rhizophilus]|uniref:IDEAL domain-containing protein n=1 Tax=Neobacillus rhizophilus TaxID=2833579 RepID=UPI0035584350